MDRSRPLFRFDAGWLFVLAGMALVLAATVIPSERQLHELRTQLDELRHAERNNFAIMGAYARFVNDLEEHDPSLVRRLAASQLNVIPRGETPLLMASSVNASVPEWIEATVELEPFQAPPPPDTLLARLTEGRGRLWAIGVGGFFVFAGLLFGPGGRRGIEPTSTLPSEAEPVDGAELSASVEQAELDACEEGVDDDETSKEEETRATA